MSLGSPQPECPPLAELCQLALVLPAPSAAGLQRRLARAALLAESLLAEACQWALVPHLCPPLPVAMRLSATLPAKALVLAAPRRLAPAWLALPAWRRLARALWELAMQLQEAKLVGFLRVKPRLPAEASAPRELAMHLRQAKLVGFLWVKPRSPAEASLKQGLPLAALGLGQALQLTCRFLLSEW